MQTTMRRTFLASSGPSLHSFCQQQLSYQSRRSFVSNPFKSEIQTLKATRTVSYPASVIYSVVSDISSYSKFLPFCHSSAVTKSSSPDSNNKTWPEEAKLVIGYNDGISETFWSRVYCQPELIVEAVSGRSETSLKKDLISHHNERPSSDDPTRNEAVLTHLLTRWTLRPFPFKPGPIKSGEQPQQHTSDEPAREQVEVMLAIEYQFANPMYAAMSSAVAPKVADYMMEAFEKRVKSLIDGPSAGGKIGALEGVLRSGGSSP